MATVNKDFKIKNGLVVEGTTATVNNYDILTKKQDDQDYIVSLIGGTATSDNTANTVVKRDASGNFAAGTITANLTGQVSTLSNHDTDDLSEGSTRLYFTNQRALDATSAAYDAAGTAATEAGYVASDLSDHENATEAHGATGAVVGTTNTQTLTNKTIGDTLNFTGAGAMTINSDSHIVLTPAAGSDVKWGADVLATENYVDSAVNALDTDAIEEGQDNLYFTSARAIAAVGGTIGDAINDLTTSDIEEGSNLYFTNQRALDATAQAYDVYGAASAADISARGYADGLAVNYDSAGSAAAAQTAAALDATTKANNAKSGAEATAAADATSKANAAQSAAISAAATDATTKANAAKTAAEATASADATSKANAAQAAAEATASAALTTAIGTEVTDRNSAIATAKSQAIQDAKDYTDAEVAALVDSAPDLLNTLDELAQAIAANPNYATDAATAVAGRVAKAGDTMTGALTLSGAPTLDLHAATKGYVDGELSTLDTAAAGYASDVADDLSAHELLTSGVHGVTGLVVGTTDLQDLSNKRIIDALQFSDGTTIANEAEIVVVAGSHDFEVNAKSGDLALKSAGDNIVLTPGTGKDVKWGADIVATQNYADGIVSDVLDGTTAFSAVNIDSLAKEVAATATISSPSTVTALTWDTTAYRTVKALVKFATPNETSVSEILLTLDGANNIAITEYAMVDTNVSLGSTTATVVAGEGRLNVTTLNNATVVFVRATLLV